MLRLPRYCLQSAINVQNLLGILPKVHKMQQQVGKKEANALPSNSGIAGRLCFAGIWGHYAVNNNICRRYLKSHACCRIRR